MGSVLPLSAEPAYPSPESITRQKILDATLHGIAARGLGKLRIGDVATDMGVSRQTIYNYFPSRNALLAATFGREGFQLAEAVARHIAGIARLDDKFVQALLFIYDAFPRNAILRHVISDGGQFLRDSGMSRQSMEAFGEVAFADIYRAHPGLQAQAAEISELMIRFVMSLLMLPDQAPRDDDALEAFLRRRLVPALGLPANP